MYWKSTVPFLWDTRYRLVRAGYSRHDSEASIYRNMRESRGVRKMAATSLPFFSKSSQSLDKIIISPPSLIVPRAALRALNNK